MILITPLVFYIICISGIALGGIVGPSVVYIQENGGRTYYRMKTYFKRKNLMKTKKINSKEVCVICFEDFTDKHRHKAATLRGCKHVYHKTCLKKWLKERLACPLCNIDLDK